MSWSVVLETPEVAALVGSVVVVSPSVVATGVDALDGRGETAGESAGGGVEVARRARFLPARGLDSSMDPSTSEELLDLLCVLSFLAVGTSTSLELRSESELSTLMVLESRKPFIRGVAFPRDVRTGRPLRSVCVTGGSSIEATT